MPLRSDESSDGPFPSAGLLERGDNGGVTIRANGRLNSPYVWSLVSNETLSVMSRKNTLILRRETAI